MLFFYLLCLKIGFLAYLSLVLSKGGLILGGRALSYLFIKMGCSGGLTLAILFAVRVLLSTEAAPSFGHMMLPAGAESGPSTAFPKLDWEVARDLPANQAAPEPLRTHVEGELRVLFNIGKKRTLPDRTFYKYIEPFALEKASVGFCKDLLERVESLQLEHFNNGEHLPFSFTSEGEKNRLYSIMWEYVP